MLDLVALFLILAVLLAALALGLRKWRHRPVKDGPEDEPYRVYTREFDLEVTAEEAIAALAGASADLSRGWLHLDDELWERWSQRTEALFGAKKLEVAADSETLNRLRAALEDASDDLVVALLIDQSGSMKGEPMIWATVSAALVSEVLDRAGIRHEVLGFSTAGWHGGHAYSQWRDAGRPKRPGRLCALRHVIYKSAEEPLLSAAARKAMVHPDLLRENVDGEALLWAAGRLMERPERHRLLLVVSDGAPVDDATLQHNGPSYLDRHIRAVLAQLDQTEGLTLGGLGINHRVDAYYPIAETVEAADRLPAASLRLLTAMLEWSGGKAQMS